MKFSKKVILLVFVFAYQITFAQSIKHSVGATIENLVGDVTNSGTKSQVYITQLYATYFPRYNVFEGMKTSLSVGSPLSLGIALADVDNGSDFGVAFGYDLPLVLDYNFGFKATDNESEGKKLGGYVGTGFSYSKIMISKTTNSNFTGTSYGPLFRAGIRFGNKKDESWGNKAVEINFYYKPGLEKEKYTSFGSAVLMNF